MSDKMTIDKILEINKRYSYIESIIEFVKDTELNITLIKDIKSLYLICGFGDVNPFYDALRDEDWDKLFDKNWDGDGTYNVEIVYKNIPESDGHQHWYYYDVDDIRFYKYNEYELMYSNSIPFDWGDLDLNN